jgi:hypothetical protein
MGVFQSLLSEPNGKQTIQAKSIRVEEKAEVVVMDLVPVQADVVESLLADAGMHRSAAIPRQTERRIICQPC